MLIYMRDDYFSLWFWDVQSRFSWLYAPIQNIEWQQYVVGGGGPASPRRQETEYKTTRLQGKGSQTSPTAAHYLKLVSRTF